MRKHIYIVLIVALAGLLAACSSAPATSRAAEAEPTNEAVSETRATLLEDYDDALSLVNQLALGTLLMEGTEHQLTAEQANTILPLWQVIIALSESSTSAPEEMEAVQNQIMNALTPTQIGEVAAMQLTNARLQEYYVEIGATEVKTPEPDATPQSGGMRDLSQEEREAAKATAEALGTPVGTGNSTGSTKRDILLDNVIELLTARGGAS